MSESQNIEWKESWRDEYLKWVCGFANAQGGDGLWLRFPFSAAYQVPDSPIGSATTLKTILKTTPKTTQERILALLEVIKQARRWFWRVCKRPMETVLLKQKTSGERPRSNVTNDLF